MRTVLYTHDLIPITVMKLEPWMVQFLREHGSFYLAVTPPISRSIAPPDRQESIKFHSVRITAERFRYKDAETFMLFTHDEESALLIRAAFLPGQQREINEVKEVEFARGFFAALRF